MKFKYLFWGIVGMNIFAEMVSDLETDYMSPEKGLWSTSEIHVNLSPLNQEDNLDKEVKVFSIRRSFPGHGPHVQPTYTKNNKAIPEVKLLSGTMFVVMASLFFLPVLGITFVVTVVMSKLSLDSEAAFTTLLVDHVGIRIVILIMSGFGCLVGGLGFQIVRRTRLVGNESEHKERDVEVGGKPEDEEAKVDVWPWRLN